MGAITGLLGTSLITDDTIQQYHLGQVLMGDDGCEYNYVKAGGTLSGPGYSVYIDPNFMVAYHVTTANALRGMWLALTMGAVVGQHFCWVQRAGPAQLQVSPSCAANVRINTTATAGQLDDDGTAGAYSIEGLVLTAARAASAGLASCSLNWPLIGAIL